MKDQRNLKQREFGYYEIGSVTRDDRKPFCLYVWVIRNIVLVASD